MGRKLSSARLGAFQDCLAVLEPLDARDVVAVLDALGSFKHWCIPRLREPGPKRQANEDEPEDD